MSEIVRLRTRAEIDDEAAAWTWRLDGEQAGPADREAFEAWLRQDPRHRRAFEEFSRVWRTLDGLEEAKRGEMLATFAGAARVRAVRPSPRWWLGAAAVLIGAIAAVVWMRQEAEIQAFSTAVGQQREVRLADGSIVSLNTNSIVETDLSRRDRQIYLRKGEAHFTVAHDRSRPFLVHAGDAVVRAVGTEFEVRLLADQHVDIVVNEGRVEVQAMPAGSGPEAVPRPSRRPVAALKAGEALSTAAAHYSVREVTPEQLSSEMAWREGAIIFDGQPLADAIAEIERYTDARIVVSDPATAALRVGGRFRTDNVQEFFQGLESALPVSIRRAADGVIYIDPRR
ncbi:MAG TPA: FecR domain-containing protein [Steroidobacteraceae bacterium]|jgi:transmembrane sensor|nr:FecR domain-containing protein [Steroidobacteraceae bacterium]